MKQRFARVRLSWLVLLLGALAGVLAMAEPVRFADRPHRKIAVAIVFSAELAYGEQATDDAIALLRQRLDRGDQVAWVYPEAMAIWNDRHEIPPEGAPDFIIIGPQNAVNRTASRVAMSGIPADVQQTIWIVPSGFSPATRPGDAVVSIPYELPVVTFEAAGATQTKDGTEVYIRLRTHGTEVPGSLAVGDISQTSGTVIYSKVTPVKASLTIPRRGDTERQRLELSVWNPAMMQAVGSELARATLTARRTEPIRIAILGTPSAVLDAYLASDPGVLRVGSTGEADIVIAQGLAATQTDKPTLWLDPPKPPSGLQKDSELEASTLASVAVTDAEFGDGVSWASMAVRKAMLLAPAEMDDRWIPVAAVGDGGLIFRTAPERTGQAVTREVVWTFGLSPQNTNVESSPAFVVLLANTCRWLATSGGESGDRWVYTVPAMRAIGRQQNTNLPLDIQPSRPCATVAQQMDSLELPRRQYRTEPIGYSRELMIATMACWVLGFILLSRGR